MLAETTFPSTAFVCGIEVQANRLRRRDILRRGMGRGRTAAGIGVCLRIDSNVSIVKNNVLLCPSER